MKVSSSGCCLAVILGASTAPNKRKVRRCGLVADRRCAETLAPPGKARCGPDSIRDARLVLILLGHWNTFRSTVSPDGPAPGRFLRRRTPDRASSLGAHFPPSGTAVPSHRTRDGTSARRQGG